jgi:hypothetical protein
MFVIMGATLWKTHKLWLLPQQWTEFHQIFMVCLSGKDTQYIVRFDTFFCPIGGAFWKRVNPLLEIVGALTWAKLQLSLWNFNILLPITTAWLGNCYSCYLGNFDVWFILWRVFCQYTKTDYFLNNERNFAKFVLYAYLVRVHDISYNFFIQIICTAPHPKSCLAHPWIHTHSGGIPCEWARSRSI